MRARFEGMIAELRTNPNVNVQSVKFGVPASAAAIIAAMRVVGGALPESTLTLS